MAAQIKEAFDIKIQLSAGKVGELSVYWYGEKLSNKGDSLDSILSKIKQKLESD